MRKHWGTCFWLRPEPNVQYVLCALQNRIIENNFQWKSMLAGHGAAAMSLSTEFLPWIVVAKSPGWAMECDCFRIPHHLLPEAYPESVGWSQDSIHTQIRVGKEFLEILERMRHCWREEVETNVAWKVFIGCTFPMRLAQFYSLQANRLTSKLWHLDIRNGKPYEKLSIDSRASPQVSIALSIYLLSYISLSWFPFLSHPLHSPASSPRPGTPRKFLTITMALQISYNLRSLGRDLNRIPYPILWLYHQHIKIECSRTKMLLMGSALSLTSISQNVPIRRTVGLSI